MNNVIQSCIQLQIQSILNICTVHTAAVAYWLEAFPFTLCAILCNYRTHIFLDSAIITQDADKEAAMSCGVQMSLKQRSIRRAVNMSFSYGFIHIHTYNSPPKPLSCPLMDFLTCGLGCLATL